MFIDENSVLKTEEYNGKAEQFPLDEIVGDDDRIVRGWVSVEIKDSQGEIIPIKQLKKVMNTWMKRGGVITDTHSNRVIGKGLNWAEKIHPKSGKKGIIIDYQIHKDYSIDDEVWDDIKSGKRKGLSFGGRALDDPTIKRDVDGTGPVKELSGIEAYEMASVEDPANKLAENTHINFLAKSKSEISIQKLEIDLRKGYAGDIQKPFAGFKDFSECNSAQQEKGHSEDSADRICGWLKHRTEDAKDKEKQEGDGGHTHEESNPKGLHTHENKEKGCEEKKEEPKSINKDFDLKLKSMTQKLNIISKIMENNKEKKKSAYKVINIPAEAGGGKVMEVEFPDGDRQVIMLKKAKQSGKGVEPAIRNAVRSFKTIKSIEKKLSVIKEKITKFKYK